MGRGDIPEPQLEEPQRGTRSDLAQAVTGSAAYLESALAPSRRASSTLPVAASILAPHGCDIAQGVDPLCLDHDLVRIEGMFSGAVPLSCAIFDLCELGPDHHDAHSWP